MTTLKTVVVFLVLLSTAHAISVTSITSMDVNGNRYFAAVDGEPGFISSLLASSPLDLLATPGETISFTRRAASDRFDIGPDPSLFEEYTVELIDVGGKIVLSTEKVKATPITEYEVAFEAFVTTTLPTFADLDSTPFNSNFFGDPEYRIRATGTLEGWQQGYHPNGELIELLATSEPMPAEGVVDFVVEGSQFRIIGYDLEGMITTVAAPNPNVGQIGIGNQSGNVSGARAVPEPGSHVIWVLIMVIGLTVHQNFGRQLQN